MQLSPDSPIGQPSLELSEDQLATAVDLICRGANEARVHLTTGMLEVPITIHVRKAMRRVKKELGLTNMEVDGEHELLNMNNNDPEVLGRIDIRMRFLQHFGDEEAYLGVECKRVSCGDSTLSRRYVTEGVDRFATGKYGAGHPWGVMLGYVLKLPVSDVVADIEKRLLNTYGDTARLALSECHAKSLSVRWGVLNQAATSHMIRLLHVFVDMTPAATHR